MGSTSHTTRNDVRHPRCLSRFGSSAIRDYQRSSVSTSPVGAGVAVFGALMLWWDSAPRRQTH